MNDEHKSMDRVYRRRRRLAEKYSLDNPGNRRNFEMLRLSMDKILKTRFDDLARIKFLDLGAGELFWVDQFISMGMAPGNCIGADVLLWRLKDGRNAGHGCQAVAASAGRLPFSDGSFDVVTQMTMMTSVLGSDAKSAISGEMRRVVKAGGYILWYDFRFNNPANPDTCAIRLSEIKRLFTGWPVVAEKITLWPQLARGLGGFSTGLLNFFDLFPILRTHYLAVIGPKEKYEN